MDVLMPREGRKPEAAKGKYSPRFYQKLTARPCNIASAATGFLPSRGIHSIPGDKKKPGCFQTGLRGY
jgi:hypothetical protein